MSKVNYLEMSDVHKVKRFTVISDKKSAINGRSTFWVIFWFLVCFPVLIFVLPYYAFSKNLSTIKAELYSGEKIVYESVTEEVINALNRSCDF